MKATIDGKVLTKVLEWANTFVSGHKGAPVLQSVRIEANGKLIVRACDGENFGEKTSPCETLEEGVVCVPFAPLRNAVLDDGGVTLELDGSRLIVTQGRNKSKLSTTMADEFPSMPNEPKEFTPTTDEFWNTVKMVELAALDGKGVGSRPYLASVYLKDGNAVATDTHRMHVAKTVSFDEELRINAKAVKSAVAMGSPEIGRDDNNVWLKSEDAVCCFRPSWGQFPNWERVVPTEFTRTWTCDKSELIEALRFMSGKAKAEKITATLEGESIVLSCLEESTGETKVEIPVVARHGDITIAFNRAYMIDALNGFTGDAAVWQMTEPTRPFILGNKENDREQFCVVMPMALG